MGDEDGLAGVVEGAGAGVAVVQAVERGGHDMCGDRRGRGWRGKSRPGQTGDLLDVFLQERVGHLGIEGG